MRLTLRTFAGVFLMISALRAGALEESYRVRERGESQVFEISRSEMHRHGNLQRFRTALRSAAEVRAAADGGDVVLYPKGAPRDASTRRYATRLVAVRLSPGVEIGPIAWLSGTRVVRAIGKRERWHLLEARSQAGSALEAAEAITRMPGVIAVEPQLARQRVRRVVPPDPLFTRQWHLSNVGQGGGAVGVDINVTSVWDTIRGAGVVIGIVDDGLEHSHPDISANYSAALSFDFNFHDAEPEPPRFSFDDHGTACAGIAAARAFNDRGVVGAAYEAKLAGLRLISLPTTDVDEADAFAFRNDAIHIKSNSWGPTDNAKILDGPGPISRAALEDGVIDGRGGLGTIFVWAGGNGGEQGDNSNYDGYANRPEVIAIGAVGNAGALAGYSEQGANILAVAPSSGGSLGVTTTDRKGEDGFNFTGRLDPVGDRDYTGAFGGTSAAAPLAAGVIALMLQANPQLGWRDVREILIRTCRKISPSDADWVTNGAGFSFNHKFGAGLIDAAAAVELAKTWQNLRPRIFAMREEKFGAEIIPDNSPVGVVNNFHFTESELRVEYVSVTVDIRHSRRGQVRIEVESPAGTRSVLASGRSRDIGKNFMQWTFTSVRHWGENAAGTWKVRVVDLVKKTVGTVVQMKVELSGSEFPLPLSGAGATLVAEQNVDGNFQSGERVTAEFALKNTTGNLIEGVEAALAEENGVIDPSGPQDYGTIAPGETVSRPFTFTVGRQPGEMIRAALMLRNDEGDLNRATFKLIAGRRPLVPRRHSEPGAITIPRTGTTGFASRYPGIITVYPFGLPPGTLPVVTKITVTLRGFTHARTEDVDILLVSASTGRNVILMSDAGTGPVNGINLTFDDDAAVPLSSAPLSSGTYRPRNLGSRNDLMPGAPPKPYGNSLSVFNGIVPLDQWLLYIRDDQTGAVGLIDNWEMTLDYAY